MELQVNEPLRKQSDVIRECENILRLGGYPVQITNVKEVDKDTYGFYFKISDCPNEFQFMPYTLPRLRTTNHKWSNTWLIYSVEDFINFMDNKEYNNTYWTTPPNWYNDEL